MPRITLKPNSAEFADDNSSAPNLHHCDMPGCAQQADYKAPKHRGLNEYYRFCLDHVREYNQAWDFFSGMAPSEVEEHMLDSIYGHRPTRRFDMHAATEALKRKAWQTYYNTEEEPPQAENVRRAVGSDRNTPEFEALAIMGLEPPVQLPDIKTRYKELAKKHHPDLNQGNPQSEELLKRINMAYTILKVAYENFEKLPDRS